MHLETKRLILRPLQASDAHALATIWTDPDVTHFMGGPRDYAKLISSFEQDAKANPPPRFDLFPVIEKSFGNIVGHCGLLDKEIEGTTEIELVYVFAKSAWGKGYATEIASALRDYAFDALKLNRIVSLIEPENAASQHVAQKAGMTHEKDVVRPGGAIRQLFVAIHKDSWDVQYHADTCHLCAPREPNNKSRLFIAKLEVSSLYLKTDQRFRGYSVLIFDSHHAVALDQFDKAEYDAFMHDLRTSSSAIRSALKPDHMNYECLGNGDPHLHWHIVPRHKNDPRWGQPIWESWRCKECTTSPVMLATEEYDAMIEKIRRQLPQ